MGSVFGVEMHFTPTEGLQMGTEAQTLGLGEARDSGQRAMTMILSRPVPT